jgi:hypothetical protein
VVAKGPLSVHKLSLTRTLILLPTYLSKDLSLVLFESWTQMNQENQDILTTDLR